MAIVSVVRTISAVRYDGTNSADVLSVFLPHAGFNNAPNQPAIHSEAGGVLTIRYADGGGGFPVDIAVNNGQWVIAPEENQFPEITATGVVPLTSLVNP